MQKTQKSTLRELHVLQDFALIPITFFTTALLPYLTQKHIKVSTVTMFSTDPLVSLFSERDLRMFLVHV